MSFDCEVLTLFPQMVWGYARESVLGRAIASGNVQLTATNIRDFATDRHHTADDAPYGGGPGMVMRAEPVVAAIHAARLRIPRAPVLMLSPRGPVFSQDRARELAQGAGIILVCGRYEGVDERVLPSCDGELSIGDFVLTGGELAALCVVDAVARLCPGVLGNRDSAGDESFQNGLLEYPHYTRPALFQGLPVPAVLQGGDHAQIARWRLRQSLVLTRDRRPDLWAKYQLTPAEAALLETDEFDRVENAKAAAQAPTGPHVVLDEE